MLSLCNINCWSSFLVWLAFGQNDGVAEVASEHLNVVTVRSVKRRVSGLV